MHVWAYRAVEVHFGVQLKRNRTYLFAGFLKGGEQKLVFGVFDVGIKLGIV